MKPNNYNRNYYTSDCGIFTAYYSTYCGLHNVSGPAIKYHDERFFYKNEYWLNNIHYSDIKNDEEWLIFQIIN